MEVSRRVFLSVFILISVCISICVFLSPLCYLGGDNYIHYKFAHYSWQLPYLFLDHWGKPVYTLLCSPFAQFGFTAAKFFNVIAGIAAAYLTYLTAVKSGYKNAWLAFLIVCFSPMYFMMINTVMTEIAFSFFLILGVWLFLEHRFVMCALIISFIPLVRTEGFLVIIFFFIAFVLNRNWKYTPLLAAGFLLYSIIGYFFVYHDFFWIINKNPYNGNGAGLYGSGPLLYFVESYRFITGIPLSFLLLIGSVVMLVAAVRINKIKGLIFNNELLLILYPALGYLVMHSLAWWLGKLNSAGEVRVFAAIIPLTSLLALKGWNFLQQTFFKNTWVHRAALLTLLIFMYQGVAYVYPMGYKLNDVEKVCSNASQWLKASPHYNNKIYYYDPVFYVLLSLNPYDSSRIQEKIPDNDHPENSIKLGDIVIWDAHFTPNEGGLSLDKLLLNEKFKLVNLFEPESPFKVLGGYDYAVYIFKRVSGLENLSATGVLKYYDFEQKFIDSDSNYISTEHSQSGKHSYKYNNEKSFSPAVNLSVKDLRKNGTHKLIAEVEIFPVYNPITNPTVLIISFENNVAAYSYNGVKFESTNPELKQWNHLSLECNIPPQAKDEDIVKIYVYQQGSKFIYIDNFKVSALNIKN